MTKRRLSLSQRPGRELRPDEGPLVLVTPFVASHDVEEDLPRQIVRLRFFAAKPLFKEVEFQILRHRAAQRLVVDAAVRIRIDAVRPRPHPHEHAASVPPEPVPEVKGLDADHVEPTALIEDIRLRLVKIADVGKPLPERIAPLRVADNLVVVVRSGKTPVPARLKRVDATAVRKVEIVGIENHHARRAGDKRGVTAPHRAKLRPPRKGAAAHDHASVAPRPGGDPAQHVIRIVDGERTIGREASFAAARATAVDVHAGVAALVGPLLRPFVDLRRRLVGREDEARADLPFLRRRRHVDRRPQAHGIPQRQRGRNGFARRTDGGQHEHRTRNG